MGLRREDVCVGVLLQSCCSVPLSFVWILRKFDLDPRCTVTIPWFSLSCTSAGSPCKAYQECFLPHLWVTQAHFRVALANIFACLGRLLKSDRTNPLSTLHSTTLAFLGRLMRGCCLGCPLDTPTAKSLCSACSQRGHVLPLARSLLRAPLYLRVIKAESPWLISSVYIFSSAGLLQAWFVQ